MRYLFALAFVLTFGVLACASPPETLSIKRGKLYQSTPSSLVAISSNTTSAIVSKQYPAGIPSSQNKGPKLQQGSDLAMHFSVVPGTDVPLILLAILHFDDVNNKPRTDCNKDRPQLLKVLLRTTISPNAP